MQGRVINQKSWTYIWDLPDITVAITLLNGEDVLKTNAQWLIVVAKKVQQTMPQAYQFMIT